MFVFFHPCCKSESADVTQPSEHEPSKDNSRTSSGMKEKKYDEDSRDEPRDQTTSGPSIKDSLLSIKFLSICIYATIAQTRMNSIPGWTYSWLQVRIILTIFTRNVFMLGKLISLELADRTVRTPFEDVRTHIWHPESMIWIFKSFQNTDNSSCERLRYHHKMSGTDLDKG